MYMEYYIRRIPFAYSFIYEEYHAHVVFYKKMMMCMECYIRQKNVIWMGCYIRRISLHRALYTENSMCLEYCITSITSPWRIINGDYHVPCACSVIYGDDYVHVMLYQSVIYGEYHVHAVLYTLNNMCM